jgi:hypothetical protein
MGGGTMNFKSLGQELKSFGGHLECTVCGNKQPLRNVGYKLSNGWEKCCGYTMRWITQNELNESK